MALTRMYVRQELKDHGASEAELQQFDSLTEMQFELWYLICYESLD